MPRIPPHLTANARSLRREATEAELKLWAVLAGQRPRFTRQLVAGPYILDLACRRVKVAVEIDGGQHAEAAGYDAARTAFLERLGWTVLRFWNSDVLENPDGVAQAVLIAVRERLGDSAFAS
jgi:very-short-patch-repair endonuclease